jgi:acylphosphatase
MTARRFVVSGKVQGVWFRASTCQQAQALGLRGYARNQPDGTVEVLAIGDALPIAQLERWLWKGPPLAEVSNVAGVDADAAEFSGTGFASG